MKKIKLFRLNGLFILGIILSVISSFINLVIPLQIKKVIDFKQLISHKISWKLIAGVITLLVISTFVNTLSSFIISREGDKQIANIRLQVQSHLLKLPISFFNNQISGQLASRVINDSYVVKTFMTQVIPSLINNIITVVGTFTLLFILDWKITTLVLLGFPLLFSIAFPLGKVMEKLSSKSQRQLSQLTGITTESLQGIRSVKLNMAESGILDKFKISVLNLYKISVKGDWINAIVGPIQTLLTFGIIIFIITYGGMRVSMGTLTIGTLVSILIYFFQVMPAVDSLASFYTNYKQAMGATKQISEIINLPEENDNKGDIVPNQRKDDTLFLDNIQFSYANKQILNNVNMEFPNRKKIAIVGPSGAGKTTIINLLTRLYPLDNGKILLGEMDANNYELSSWRELFSVVTQENSVISGTIRDNLLFGSTTKISELDLENALKSANLLTVVQRLSNGLETVVGEQGIKLSGGERQRLQIARAYLRDTRFIIFDEATSNLDADTEKLVSASMNKLTSTKTVIAIAHRLSTIVDADYIYFLDKNTIQAGGTHQALMQTLPAYRTFVTEQILPQLED
ncbi:ABC transporter ATP-binding protein [Latilactobacillus sakei]